MITGLISGCFDGPSDNCPHAGHWYILEQCKKSCDELIVLANDDNYIRTIKKREPLTTELKRVENLYLTLLVDRVILYSEKTPLNLILKIRPDIIYCGNDYKKENVVGYKECSKWNGIIQIINRIPNISTTEIIRNY